MAAAQQKNGSVLQVWLPHPTDERLRRQAKAERRSLSQTIRIAVEQSFAETISMWQMSDKAIPLHWNHSSDPEDIIGTVDPASMKETSEGLQVNGRLDLEESAKAREIWRSVKSGAISLSFGYLVKDERKGKDGIRVLTELDLFEISLTPAPVNSDTRILSTKSHQPVQIATFKC
jgi:HK97 family phage prohead protease